MKRIPRLDGLRAFAFLAVFFNHAVHLPMAWVGVDLFFVLSGFLITSLLLVAREQPARRFFLDFYGRRAQRILPPYLLVLGLVALFSTGIDWPTVWWKFALFLQNNSVAFGDKVGVLNPYWSLAVEEQYYLVWPVLVFLLPRRALLAVCGFLIAMAPLLRAYYTERGSAFTVIFCLTPFRMDLLAAGSLIGVLWTGKSPRLAKAEPYAWFVGFLSAATLFLPAMVFPAWRATADSLAFNVFGYSSSVLCFCSLLILVLISRMRLWDLLFSNAVVMFLGRISYMCYLLHELSLSLLIPRLGRAGGSLAALAATVATATLSWYFMERPILKVGRGQPGPK